MLYFTLIPLLYTRKKAYLLILKTFSWEKSILTYGIVISAWCSMRNKALAVSCFCIDWCNSVRPSEFFSLMLAPAPNSLAASLWRLLHRAKPNTVWPSESFRLKLGRIFIPFSQLAAFTKIFWKVYSFSETCLK